MTRHQAITAATERARATGRYWCAVSDEQGTWWIEPDEAAVTDCIICDGDGPIGDEE